MGLEMLIMLLLIHEIHWTTDTLLSLGGGGGGAKLPLTHPKINFVGKCEDKEGVAVRKRINKTAK